MRFNSTARRIYVVPALGLTLVTAMSACSSSGSSSAPAASSAATPSSAAASAAASTAASATITLTAPGSASGSASAAAGGSSSAVSQITTNWNTFFNSSTPNSKRVQLLENGSQFASAISAFASSPLASAVTSKVDSVTVTSATKAKVKYDLTAMGTAVATGQTGSSVLQDGTWKVGDDVFCGLLSEAKGAGLTVPVPSACKSAS
jgi:hypothetical protein